MKNDINKKVDKSIKEKKTIRCLHDGCLSRFRYQSELQLHSVSHSNNRNFLCDECGYHSKTSYQLKRHQRIHNDHKRFNCSYCDYNTLTVANKRRHERVHTGVKPYKCLYCTYTCNTQENLRKHILKTKQHIGKSVYPCPLCTDTQFQTNSSLNFQKHLELVHGVSKDVLPSVLVGMYTPSETKSITQGMHKNQVQVPGIMENNDQNTNAIKRGGIEVLEINQKDKGNIGFKSNNGYVQVINEENKMDKFNLIEGIKSVSSDEIRDDNGKQQPSYIHMGTIGNSHVKAFKMFSDSDKNSMLEKNNQASEMIKKLVAESVQETKDWLMNSSNGDVLDSISKEEVDTVKLDNLQKKCYVISNGKLTNAKKTFNLEAKINTKIDNNNNQTLSDNANKPFIMFL